MQLASIVFLCFSGYTLFNLKKVDPSKRYSAGAGVNSQQFSLVGKPGSDVVIQAPLGTVCATDAGMQLGEGFELAICVYFLCMQFPHGH